MSDTKPRVDRDEYGKKITQENKRNPPPRKLSKLTPVLMEACVEYIRRGCYIETAAGACGIAKATLYNWLKWGAEGREPYKTFHDQALQARDEAEALDVTNIGEHAAKDWRASAWRLERMHGRKYAGITVTEGRLDVEVKSNEEIAERVRAIYGIAPAPLLEADPGTSPGTLGTTQKAADIRDEGSHDQGEPDPGEGDGDGY